MSFPSAISKRFNGDLKKLGHFSKPCKNDTTSSSMLNVGLSMWNWYTCRHKQLAGPKDPMDGIILHITDGIWITVEASTNVWNRIRKLGKVMGSKILTSEPVSNGTSAAWTAQSAQINFPLIITVSSILAQPRKQKEVISLTILNKVDNRILNLPEIS